MDRVLRALEDAVGSEYVSDEEFILYTYSRGIDGALPERMPEYVVRPGSTEEVSRVVRIANRYKIPIVPRGGGCCLTGGSKPIEEGGIVMDLTRMNRILNIDFDAMTVTVECGITWAKLNTILFEKGYYTGTLGPGSGMSAVVGGGLSHHSVGGGGGAKYGTCSEHCVALEVVLPQGDIIQTGSNASIYVKEPFCRFGFGPDLLSIFLGDNGIFGIKTKATLEIFPRPEYHECKTFVLENPGEVNAAKIWLEWRKKGDLGIYDSQYLPPLTVIAYAGLLTEFPFIPAWKGIDKGIFWYTLEAYTEKELEEKVKIADEIVKKHGGEELGEKVEDGNIARWHYEMHGFWQNWHGLWNGIGPGSIPCTTEHHVPIHRVPDIFKAFEKWEEENRPLLEKAGAFSGVSTAILCGHTTVEVDSGLLVWDKPELRELNRKLWISQLQMVIKAGGMPYMTGEVYSQALVDTGAFSGPYFEFLRTLKNALDPNRILSPGKYRL
ncbi:MAG: FAD-binding oxidoreductase [Candidatus Freyarchaeota archaeon]|nr:FAD-binding oxidoreductase [Candidatus Freyrarchaeum guaymaensis]